MPETLAKDTWTKVAFGDVVRQVKDKVDPKESGLERYVAGEHMDTDDLKIRRWGIIGDDYLGPAFHMRFTPGHVLYGSRRTYLRKVALADFEGITANTTYVLESRGPDLLLPELLPFIMQTEPFHRHSIKQSKGSVNPYVNFSDLVWYEFALPPREEQRKIAELLQAVDALGESALTLLGHIRIAEASLFRDAINIGAATPTPLGELLVGSPRNGCSARPATSPTGHWVLALSAISKWGYRTGELKPVEKTNEMEAAVLKQDDLVISRSNTRELVGLPAMFSESREDVSYPDTMMRLTLDDTRARNRFLELFLRSPEGRRQVQSYAAGTSASMKKINGTNLKKVVVPLVRLEEQDTMLSLLDQFRFARACAHKRLSSKASLKLRLLGDAFQGGEVR